MRIAWIVLVAAALATPALAEPLPEAEARAVLADLLPSAGAERRQRAQLRIASARDERFAAPLIDLLRFPDSVDDLLRSATILRSFSGAPPPISPGAAWEEMLNWYGKRPDLEPPPGYAQWKGALHAELIDPRFREFFPDGVKTALRVGEIVWGGVKVDGIPALVDPRTVPAARADYLGDEEPVFGVSLNGEHRAYPLRILDWHEMANDTVGGVPVALAYCTLCGAGILFDRRAAGRTLEFGSSGLLYRSNKLMFDRQTRSLWNHLTGEPVVGELVGQAVRLRVLPVELTTWGDWRRLHPATTALSLDTGHSRPYRVGAAYGRYFASPETMFPVWRKSRLLPEKERVFALYHEGLAKAYPLPALARAGGLVNDALGGHAVVVVQRGGARRVALPPDWQRVGRELRPQPAPRDANDLDLALAHRILDRDPRLLRQLTAEMLLAMPTETRLALLDGRAPEGFPQSADPTTDPIFDPEFRNAVASRGLVGAMRAYLRGSHRFQRIDGDALVDERGRRWAMNDDALEGPAGERLLRLPGHLAYWFGWFAFYPNTEVYGAAPVSGPQE
ncbi:MAG: DUF3179 domain-containing protein [Pseudomonadota bacterium]